MLTKAEMTEITLAEMEARILESEYHVKQAEIEELEVNHNIRLTSELPTTQRLLKMINRSLEACLRLGFPFGPFAPPVTVEQSAYAWRRDYGEWPTFWNLSDRHAQDCKITQGEAVETILDALNEPSGRRQLYAVSSALLDFILTEDAPDWSSPEAQALADINNLRFYVAPTGLELFACEPSYRNSVRHLERLVA